MANVSFWDSHSMEDKVVQVLSSLTYHDRDHHFGRPFLTAYQLAVLIKERFPDTFHSFGHPIGGRDSGVSYSFTSNLAGQPSERIRNGTITCVDGGFLSNEKLKEIEFNDAGSSVFSSLTDTQFDLSMFRFIG